MNILGMWEEAGIPGKNPRIHRENMTAEEHLAPGEFKHGFFLL